MAMQFKEQVANARRQRAYEEAQGKKLATRGCLVSIGSFVVGVLFLAATSAAVATNHFPAGVTGIVIAIAVVAFWAGVIMSIVGYVRYRRA